MLTYSWYHSEMFGQQFPLNFLNIENYAIYIKTVI